MATKKKAARKATKKKATKKKAKGKATNDQIRELLIDRSGVDRKWADEHLFVMGFDD